MNDDAVRAGVHDAWSEWLEVHGRDVLLALAQGVGGSMPVPADVLTAFRDGVAADMPRPHEVLDAIEHGTAAAVR